MVAFIAEKRTTMDWMTMPSESSLNEKCRRILEEKGGKIADSARTILLKEESLKGLQRPLRHVSQNWRDPVTPFVVVVSCEAVGGQPDVATHQAALAMILLNLSSTLWDDIIDRTLYRCFAPTLLGKYGVETTLMLGGLLSARAFSMLSGLRVDERKRQIIAQLVWNYCRKLAEAETVSVQLRRRGDVKPKERFKVIEMEGVSLETLSKIGAVLGNGSEDEIKHLGDYGRYLSMSLDLIRDFKVSINLTLELAGKIRSGALPYTLIWGKSRSRKLSEHLRLVSSTVKPIDIRNIVEGILEAEALEHVTKLLNTIIHEADARLIELENTKATETLKFFLDAQPKLLAGYLSAL